MGLEHLKELRSIAKDEGVTYALIYDGIKTLEKHPKLIPYALAISMALSRPRPEPMVYVDHVEIDDGEYKLRRKGFVPVSEALNNGWITEGIYDKIMETRHTATRRREHIGGVEAIIPGKHERC